VKKTIGEDWIARVGDNVGLRISVCRNCTARWFPPRELCSTCASTDLEQNTTRSRGVAYATTVVRVGAQPFRTPYVLSYVDIDGVRLLAHVEGERVLAPDSPVQLTVGKIGADTDLWSYTVRPVCEEVTR
jgi:hypothetical protein